MVGRADHHDSRTSFSIVVGRSGREITTTRLFGIRRTCEKQFAEQNPVKAFLTKLAREWLWSSARHRDEYERLPWQCEPE